ncbi:MAG: hypothetical protein M3O95_10155 [Candidatus Dormibacteraeota bacterium]|nr:hypothetical protein [Candidatus Dormibacteraeota bacterium]MDQ6790051.1 hypothetical protein [Candidatus Dormibacteraeota bacterium]
MEDLARRFFELDPTRESLYWNVAMRGASHSMLGAKTMDGPFLLRRLAGVVGEPGPLVFVGEGSHPTGVRLIPFEAVESFELGPASESPQSQEGEGSPITGGSPQIGSSTGWLVSA